MKLFQSVSYAVMVLVLATSFTFGQDDQKGSKATFDECLDKLETKITKTSTALRKEVDEAVEKAKTALSKARERMTEAFKKRDRKKHDEARQAWQAAYSSYRRALRLQQRVRISVPSPRAKSNVHRLGLYVTGVSMTLAKQLGLPKGQGLLVYSVRKDSSADKAGLEKHDVHHNLGGKVVSAKRSDLEDMLASVKSGATINVVVIRQGKELPVSIKMPPRE